MSLPRLTSCALLLVLAASQASSSTAQPEPDVRQRAERYFAAIDAGDLTTIGTVLAADFVAIDGRGGLRTRDEYLADLRASIGLRGRPADLRRDWSGVRVVSREADAVFVGRSTWRPVRDDGRQPVVSMLLTQEWRRGADGWQVHRLQSVLLGAPPDIVSFTSGPLTLGAMVFRPSGVGPFPAVVYAHGNEPDPSSLLETVGPALAARGYLVFGPHRRGSGLSAAAAPNLLRTLTAVEQREGAAARARVALAELEGPQLDDIAAAITAVKARPDVLADEVFMMGNSFGGVLVLLAAERGLGLAGAADFAGAALNWERSELFRARLTAAARQARIPLFLGQAANDTSVGPTRELGRVLCEAGKVARAKVWPAYGVTAGDGHSFGVDAVAIWAEEVLAFLRAPTPRREPCEVPPGVPRAQP